MEDGIKVETKYTRFLDLAPLHPWRTAWSDRDPRCIGTNAMTDIPSQDRLHVQTGGSDLSL